MDTFKYLAASDSTASAYDTITDFQHGSDLIDLTAVAPTYAAMLHSGGGDLSVHLHAGGQMEIAAVGDVEGNDLLTEATPAISTSSATIMAIR